MTPKPPPGPPSPPPRREPPQAPPPQGMQATQRVTIDHYPDDDETRFVSSRTQRETVKKITDWLAERGCGRNVNQPHDPEVPLYSAFYVTPKDWGVSFGYNTDSTTIWGKLYKPTKPPLDEGTSQERPDPEQVWHAYAGTANLTVEWLIEQFPEDVLPRAGTV